MRTPRRRGPAAVVALLVASLTCSAHPALGAGDGAVAGPESAAIHFHHGVELYKDADYAGALAEFRRAQELSPNYRVLYDIGQALYELQRYAEALKAFEDYLAQGGTQIPPPRRATVQADLQALHDRVGYLDITVNADGAEVRVDDQTAGTSPLAGPVLVSVGHRKVTVVKTGRSAVERFVDVTSGDHAKVEFDLSPRDVTPAVTPQRESPPQPHDAPVPVPESAPPPPESTHSGSLAWIPWTATGVLALGTVVTGGLTLSAKGALSNDLSTFPGNPSAIAKDRSNARTFAAASDIFLAATAVSFGVALYVTLRPQKARTGAADGAVRLRLGLDGVKLQGDF